MTSCADHSEGIPDDGEGDITLRHPIEKVEGDVVVVRAAGDVDAYSAPQLREALGGAADAGGLRIVVDLAKVPYIDSTGVGVINGAATRAANAGGKLVVAGAQPQVRKVFEITGLVQRIDLHPDVDAAVASLKAHKGGGEDA